MTVMACGRLPVLLTAGCRSLRSNKAYVQEESTWRPATTCIILRLGFVFVLYATSIGLGDFGSAYLALNGALGLPSTTTLLNFVKSLNGIVERNGS